MTMKAAIIAGCVALSVLSASAAHARTYTYMCRVGQKTYPVTVTTPNEASSGSLSGGTLTWRGTTFRNVKETGDCKANFVATRDGVTVELCAATQGVADLTVGKETFECQMPGRER